MRHSIGTLATLATCAAIGLPSLAAAQIDPVAVGQGAVHSTTMRAHSNRTAGRASGGSRADTSARARSTCAQRTSIRARLGASDPRVQQIDSLCDRLGY